MRPLVAGLGLLVLAACAPAPVPPPAAPPPAPAVPCASVSHPAPAAPPAAAIASLDDAKDRVTALVNANDAAGLFELFDAVMKEAIPVERLAEILNQLRRSHGAWRSAKRMEGGDRVDGSATVGDWEVEAERGQLKLQIALNPERRITGMTFQRAPPPEKTVARSDIPLGLPFKGEWFVFWGGDTEAQNHHVGVPDQRRAADLMIVDADGKSHRTDGKTNADFLVYGQPVLAVADGTVLTVVDGTPENVPGEKNHYVIPGNYVVVRHGPTLFSAYMHLQPGKIRVKPGAAVKRGTVLGLVGNSGHSTEPHLHFQLQDGPDGNTSLGVEPAFDKVVVTRGGGKTETVSGYTFLKGDRIHSP